MGRGPLGNTQHRRAQQGQRPRLSQLSACPSRPPSPFPAPAPPAPTSRTAPQGSPCWDFPPALPLPGRVEDCFKQGFLSLILQGLQRTATPSRGFSALPQPLTACKQMTPAFSESSRSPEGRTGRGPEGLGERACGSGSWAQARFLSQLTGELNRLKAPCSELPSLTACLGPELPTTPLLPEAGR